MRSIYLVILLIFLLSCRSIEEKRCDKNFIGSWHVDTTGLDSRYRNIIVKRDWLNLKLVADSDGTFKFNSADKYLKQCEGKWYASYNREDGICVLNFKGDNHPGYVSVLSGFSVNGIFEDSTQFNIPFKKD